MEVTRLADGVSASSAEEATGATTNPNTTEKQDVGLSVSVIDQEGKPQFETGSAVILPAAKAHFSELAKQYVASDQLRKQAEGKTKEQKENIYKELKKKRILLVGHTDDTGDSKLNAKLSEERAKEVARVFKEVGVGEDQLYYQGAGETLPIADNKTEVGRAKNRRVEIVDLSNEDKFQQYLQSRRPKTTYYRPVQATTEAATPSAATQGKLVESDQPTNPTASFVDFGGVPLAASNSSPNIGKVSGGDSGFSLISSAHADTGPILSCAQDRPRSVGAVKLLQNDATYAGRDYMPGTYDSSWVANANGHLVTLTHVAVLRDGAVPVGKPSLAVYRDFKGGGNVKPTSIEPVEVNVYQGSKAMLYRAFGKGSVRCIDMVIPNKSPMSAPDSKIVYQNTSGLYVAAFDVRVIQ
jgi:outer membrane protein OmpA-like peptidoglycan-associated protein